MNTNIQVTATHPTEMVESQHKLIAWCTDKIEQVKAESKELHDAWQKAVTSKWNTVTLKRHFDLSVKRVEFYDKIKKTLEAGFYIIPTFPVTLFAIRTDVKKPRAYMTTSNWHNHDQKPKLLPAGEGENKSNLPVVNSQDSSYTNKEGKHVKQTSYWAEEFKDVDFPLIMAKPIIMEATSRAMALKIFDQFGVCPTTGCGDPMIIGQILNPHAQRLYGRRNTRHDVSFIIAWHLDTRTL